MHHKMRSGSRTLLAFASVLMLSAPAYAVPEPGEYQVGFITDSTGALAFAGLSYTRGAELAAEEISSTAYMGPGTRLKLVVKEAGGDAARSIQNFNQFAADRSIIASSCCILSAIAGSLKPIAATAKLPLVIYGATAPGLPQAPYVYSVTGLPGPEEVQMSKDIAARLKPKTAVYFVPADNDAFVNRMKASQAELEGSGVKTAGVINTLNADTDFTGPVTQAIALKPDVVMVFCTQSPSASIIAALRARGYTGTIAANDSISPPGVFKRVGAALAGIPFPTNFDPAISSNAEAKAFTTAYEKKFGTAPDLYSAQGYTAIFLIAQGLKSLDGKPGREALGEALAKVTAVAHNVYGGLPVMNGQAQMNETLIVAWTADGKIVRWQP